MDPPLINIPVAGPFYQLGIFPLTAVYSLIVYVEYLLFCKTSIPYQQYKNWCRLFHIILPIILAPDHFATITSFVAFPWFVASVGAYSAELYKEKHRKENQTVPQTFKEWIISIGREGFSESALQPNGLTMPKSDIRMEGLQRVAIDLFGLLLANQLLNPLLLDKPRDLLAFPWYSSNNIYYGSLMGLKGCSLMIVNDLQLCIYQMIFGVRTIRLFNMPMLSTSPKDFWGNRWNLVVRNMFHKQVFANKNDTTSKQWKGFRAFLISGLMHEAIAAMFTRQVTFEQLAFFLIQGLAVYAQMNFVPRRLQNRLPKPVSILFTILFMASTVRLFLGAYLRYERYAVVFGKHAII